MLFELVKLVLVGTLVKVLADEIARQMQKKSGAYQLDGVSLLLLDLALSILSDTVRKTYYDDWFVFLCDQKQPAARLVNALGLIFASLTIRFESVISWILNVKAALLIKRCIDLCVAATALVALLPLLYFVSIGLLLVEGKALTRVRCVGQGGRQFSAVRFYASKDSGIGRFLRRTAIDELPALWNVLRGDLSLVGPRAMPDETYSLLPAGLREHPRFAVPAGITGLAQAQGWHGSFDDESLNAHRFAADATYAKTWSLSLDLKIIVRTLANEFFVGVRA